MSFKTWYARTDVFGTYIQFPAVKRIAKAAYKAGERQGRKDVAMLAKKAALLRELSRLTRENEVIRHAD